MTGISFDVPNSYILKYRSCQDNNNLKDLWSYQRKKFTSRAKFQKFNSHSKQLVRFLHQNKYKDNQIVHPVGNYMFKANNTNNTLNY